MLLTLALVLTSCGWFSHPTTQTKPTTTFQTTGAKLSLEVTPTKAFTLVVPGVGTIHGSAGSVTSPGTITAQAADVSQPGSGLTVAGKGVDVDFASTELLKPLQVTFTGVNMPNDGTVPAIVHRADDGTLDMRLAHLTSSGDLQVTTSDFSSVFPASLNPGQWLMDQMHPVINFLSGHTDPPACKNDGPSWATLTNSGNLVHTCLISNRDANGNVRAEAQIAPNRSSYVFVQAPPGASYVWTNQYPAARNIAAWLWGADRGTYLVLGKDDRMTAGYSQPTQGEQLPFKVGVNGETKLLSLTFALLDVLGLNDENKVRAGLLLFSACGKDISQPFSRDSVFSYLKCVTRSSVGTLIEQDKALWNAVDILGERAYFQEGAKSLGRVTVALRALGAVLTLGDLVQDAVNGIIDDLMSVLSPTSGDVSLLLDGHRAGSKPPAPTSGDGGGDGDGGNVNPTLSISGFCTSAGGTLHGSASGFTPGGGVSYEAWYPDGRRYTNLKSHTTARSDGTAVWSWPCGGDPAGDYTAEMNDDSTGASTGGVSFTIGARPSGGGGGGGTSQPSQATISVYNQVTNGATQMREDSTAAYLSTIAATSCSRRGCKIDGTDMSTGAQLTALCQTTGEPTTNGNNNDSTDAGNPGRYSSNLYYEARASGGQVGYISFVWISPSQRTGMGLPGC